MSASEKLKALEMPARPYWDEGSHEQEHIIAANRCVDALVDALPQIVAVVKAAETLYAEAATSAPLWDEIDAALSALDEALS